MSTSKSNVPAQQIVTSLHLPFDKTRMKEKTLSRATHYVNELRRHKMVDGNIGGLLADLYWDAFEEFHSGNIKK